MDQGWLEKKTTLLDQYQNVSFAETTAYFQAAIS